MTSLLLFRFNARCQVFACRCGISLSSINYKACHARSERLLRFASPWLWSKTAVEQSLALCQTLSHWACDSKLNKLCSFLHLSQQLLAFLFRVPLLIDRNARLLWKVDYNQQVSNNTFCSSTFVVRDVKFLTLPWKITFLFDVPLLIDRNTSHFWKVDYNQRMSNDHVLQFYFCR